LFFRSGKTVTGLDVGTTTVKACRLSQQGETIELVGAAMADISERESEGVDRESRRRMATVEAISEVFAALGTEASKAGRVVTAVGGPNVSIKQVVFPKMAEQTFAESLQWEARKHVPFDPSDVVLDFQFLDDGRTPDEKKMKVLLAAVKKPLMMEHVSVLAQAGVEPRVVDLIPLALMNEADEEGLVDGRTTAVVEMGAESATLSVYRRGSTFFSRSIGLRSNGGTQSAGEKPRGKQGNGSGDSEPWVGHLLKEVRLSLRFYDNETGRKGIDRVCLAGGRALTPGIVKSFSGALDVDVRVMDPLEAFRGPKIEMGELAVHGPRFALAMGLARRR